MKILICGFTCFPIKDPERFSYLELKVCDTTSFVLFCFFSVSLFFVLLHSFWFAGWKVTPGDKVNLISGTVPAKQGDDC